MKKHRIAATLACLGLLVALSACSANPTTSTAAPPPDLPKTATPYLFCRTTHTQNGREISSSPDYDITCWKIAP